VVVERATRLVEHNQERFAKRIVARADAAGSIVLAADPADDVTRARRLVASWAPALRGADPPSHAVLARTNGELAPYAAAALEAGLPYRAQVDGLDALDDSTLNRLLAALPLASGSAKPAALLARSLPRAQAQDRAGLITLAAWAADARSIDELRQRVDEARTAR
jgi:superfamily I DNA/RNA helicase